MNVPQPMPILADPGKIGERVIKTIHGTASCNILSILIPVVFFGAGIYVLYSRWRDKFLAYNMYPMYPM